jgi:carbon-monoxide dehydrogenase medium subunit
MILPHFKLYKPRNIDEALEALEERGDEVVVFAGGTKIMLLMQWGMARPNYIMDIKSLGLNHVKYEDGKLTVEAGVTLNELIDNEVIRERFSLLYETIKSIADDIIRNKATLVGNIVDAAPYATAVPAFLLLNGKAVLRSKEGTREVDGLDFFVDIMKTAQKPNELVIAIQFDEIKGKTKFLDFKGDSLFSVVNVAAIKYSQGGHDLVKVAITGLTNKPVIVDFSDQYAESKGNVDAFLRKAREYIRSEYKTEVIADARASADYRLHVTSVLVSRALEVVVHE